MNFYQFFFCILNLFYVVSATLQSQKNMGSPKKLILDCPDGRHFCDILLPCGYPLVRQSQNTIYAPYNYTLNPWKSQGKRSLKLHILTKNKLRFLWKISNSILLPSHGFHSRYICICLFLCRKAWKYAEYQALHLLYISGFCILRCW